MVFKNKGKGIVRTIRERPVLKEREVISTSTDKRKYTAGQKHRSREKGKKWTADAFSGTWGWSRLGIGTEKRKKVFLPVSGQHYH